MTDLNNTTVGDLPSYEFPVGSVVEFAITKWSNDANEKMGSITRFLLKPHSIVEWGDGDEPEEAVLRRDFPLVEKVFFGDKGLTDAVSWLQRFAEIEVDEDATLSEVFSGARGAIVTQSLTGYREANGRKFGQWRNVANA